VFGNKKKQVNNNASIARVNNTPSIISQDMRITGSLTSQGEVQLDGRIDGDIKAAHLVIGVSGVVEGIVEAKSIIVKGKIIGSLNASEVTIKNSAHLHGDIFHDSLSIEAGATIEGNLKQRFEQESLTATSEELKSVDDVKTLFDEDDSGLSFVNKPATDQS
jgi:cytoskeletal protein CcmA (bactofilin family)